MRRATVSTVAPRTPRTHGTAAPGAVLRAATVLAIFGATWLPATRLAVPGVGASPLVAQEATDAPQLSGPLLPGDTVMATPFGRYEAGAIHRWVLGEGHRSLWSTPVPARVLDLESYAGGLEPLRLGGGQQTRSLRFQGADGLVYNFRSIDKDAARTLDPQLRETLAADILQDQIAALFPLSAMVVAPLLDAAGILHPQPELVVMPDDPKLGEFREMFAGMLGWIEVRPDERGDDDPGFAGSARVVGSDRLLERLEEEPDNRIDAPEFLRARLMDFLVGDWDRHPDQWRWAGFEGEMDGRDVLIFEPVPRDRDWALARLDGMIAQFTWVPWPQYVGFDEEFPSAFRLGWNGRGLDRRLLSEMEWEEWQAVVDDLESRLTDSVITAAVRRLPDAYYERVGSRMEEALLHRRDELPRLARDFYDLHSGWVDIDTTDDGELARLTRLEGDRLRVEVFDLKDGVPRPRPHYDRTFLGSETHEVRLYMHGGDDAVHVLGEDPGRIRIRVVGGGSDDSFVDATDGRRVHFYDDRGDNTFLPAPHTEVDRSDYEAPDDAAAEQHAARPRDWGSRWIPLPRLSFDPDLGLFVGGGARLTTWGFRHYPFQSRLDVTAGISTATGRARATLDLDLPLWDRTLRAHVSLLASGAEFERFYGFGNGTAFDRSRDFFEAQRRLFRLRPLLSWRPNTDFELRAGPDLALLRPYDNPGTLIEQLDPYGYGDFEQAGLVVLARWDRRDDRLAPRHGTFLEVETRLVPDLLDVTDPFGRLSVKGMAYLSHDAGLRPSLAIRAGGAKVWGDVVPYFESAFLGGSDDLRGFRTHRFAGDGSLFLNTELRLFLTDFLFLLPGDLGVLGLTDVGRVWLDGEDSSRWHSAVGGGLWARWVDAYTVSLTVAHSDEETDLYFSLGFPF